MSKTFICTVGTSVKQSCRSLACPEGWDDDGLADAINQLVNAAASQPVATQGAEMASLDKLGLTEEDRVVLLASDTGEGRCCAEALARLIPRRFALGRDRVAVQRVVGLQVMDAEAFRREGAANLARAVLAANEQYGWAAGGEVVVNVTGGFKGAVPIATIIATLLGLRVVYLFERSEALITLPPLPINHDIELFRRVAPALSALREKDAMPTQQFHNLITDFKPEEASLFAPYIEEVDHLCTASPLATILEAIEEPRADGLLLAEEVVQRLNALPARPDDQRKRAQKMLADAASPVKREQLYHKFNRTDLTVLKWRASEDRLAGFITDGIYKVCKLYTDHAEYEKDLAGATLAQFENETFLPVSAVEWMD